MHTLRFLRVAACSPMVKPADIDFNVERIKINIDECLSNDVDVALFPELSLTGYTCGDLFHQNLLLSRAKDALFDLAEYYANLPITVVVGLPVIVNNNLLNCAAVINQGNIKGIVPKSYIPNYGEFYEKRWFTSGLEVFEKEIILRHSEKEAEIKVPFGTDLLFDIEGVKTGIEICEDLWVPIPPSSVMAINGATLILNLSATNELIGKYKYLCDLIANQSARCRCAYVYASAGVGESSTDLAFAGNCIIAENGTIISSSKRFDINDKLCIADIDIENLLRDRIHFETFYNQHYRSEFKIIDINYKQKSKCSPTQLFRKINSMPFIDKDKLKMKERCEEISSIQAWGLAMRLRSINCRKAIVGVSGGLDSTLALLITAKAFDILGYPHSGIIAIDMPGFGTTKRTSANARTLMDLLGVSHQSIPIGEAVKQHFKDIDHDDNIHDVTYENSQARMRTLILMDIANKENGIVVGTGDLSELALGWCTYNGDQMSMYGVNASIPKTLVRYLIEGFIEATDNQKLKEVLHDIIDTPISPELLPPTDADEINQKTEDLVGPYELHDFFLYHLLRYGASPRKIFELAKIAFNDKYNPETILKWLKIFYHRFFSQQFKRSAMPDGIKAGSICLSPRGDWRMPSDASVQTFLRELDEV